MLKKHKEDKLKFGMDVTNQSPISEASGKKLKKSSTPKEKEKIDEEDMSAQNLVRCIGNSLTFQSSPVSKEVLNSKKRMQKELMRLADWLSGMEENQVEYSKVIVQLGDQLEAIKKG